jgi:hypothetical protein
VQQLSLFAPQLVRPLPLVRQLVPVVVEPSHAPPLHAPVEHGQGAPHRPSSAQFCTVETPAHCVTPGMQLPASPELPIDPSLPTGPRSVEWSSHAVAAQTINAQKPGQSFRTVYEFTISKFTIASSQAERHVRATSMHDTPARPAASIYPADRYAQPSEPIPPAWLTAAAISGEWGVPPLTPARSEAETRMPSLPISASITR